ncbi:MAG: single-stranded-DNA-specific exonuclease RecJ [Oscillospiraceae bacterium]|nr:single-stranded-DNA-specific exonuclease RecJ [Oscillospiraceae bacterium]
MKYQQWQKAHCPFPARRALEDAGFPPLVAMTLAARGIETEQEAQVFLASGAELFCDPMEMQDIDVAAARLEAALGAGEKIAVYGDYDVDGITATCLMTHYLRLRGGTVVSYIPDRMEEGYGVNCGAITALHAQGVSLIVTVDCGITAVAEAEFARALGVDMIITDHHTCRFPLPGAVAVVNPRRPDCGYPFKQLAGVGVALKLVLAMGGKEQEERWLTQYADLAAMGTIADVMEMVGENRAIVARGLYALERTTRPGLRALIRESGLSGKPITAVSVGYSLSPRINAAGRMGCADVALELLLTEDPARGEALAQQLCALNKERQAVEAEIVAACIERADRLWTQERHVLVLAGDAWHQGVIGIVASRLSERYACPVFVISVQDGKGKGSCRSYGGINLFDALQQCEDLLESFGGHALAAGFFIDCARIDAFRAAMEAYVAGCMDAEEYGTLLEIDGEVEHPALLTREAVETLEMLEPCGVGNPKPVFTLSGCTVASMSDVGGGRHLKLRLIFCGQSIDAIFFSATGAQAGIAVGDRIDVAFILQINEFRGLRTVQLQLCDLRPACTRAEREKTLYERLVSGAALTPPEAVAMLPSRDDFVAIWRYIKQNGDHGALRGTAQRLARACGGQETALRAMVCLEVFSERGLIELTQDAGRFQISINETREKVNLEQSYILRSLRRFAHM